LVARHARRTVLILVENLPVPFDRRVWQEARSLNDAGYEVHVVCPRTAECPAPRQRLHGIAIYRYRQIHEARRGLGYLLEYPVAVLSMLALSLRIRARRRIDVVHICNPPDLLFIVAGPLKLAGARIVFDHHDAAPELAIAKGYLPDGRLVRACRLLERVTYRTADAVIATNDSYRALALGRGRRTDEDVFVVRSAPAVDRFAGSQPDITWRNGRRLMVAYVGVMGEQDGVDLLLDAADFVINRCGRDDVQFVIAGDGPERTRLRERARQLELGDRVSFPGRVPDAALAAILTTADVCVNPDPATAFNDISTMNKTLEYLSLGKPVVQFDLCEGRRSAGEASLYADPREPGSLARCLLELLDDAELRDRMGRRARERFTGQLTWERQVPRLLAAYDRALSGGHAGPGHVDRLIIHQWDAATPAPGGIDTCLRGLCTHAPAGLSLAIVGVDATLDAARPLGVWEQHRFGDRTVWFMPVARLDKARTDRRVPDAVQVALGVMRFRRRMPASALVQVHRVDLGMLALLAFRRPLAFFVHNQADALAGSGSDSLWRHLGPLHRWCERGVATRAARVVVFNPSYVRTVQRWNPTATAMPTWFDPALCHPDARRDPHHVLWVGRFERSKDPLLAIEAFRALAQTAEGTAWRLTMIGAGSLERDVDEARRALPPGVAERVEVIGRLRPPAVAAAMAAAGALLMTSQPGYEGYSRVLVEAMACGLVPIVTAGSDTGGLITPSVGAVCSRHPDDLAGALRRSPMIDRDAVAARVAGLNAATLVPLTFARSALGPPAADA
jgi:glycosyltransferase involved in cell wall biosynthesis